MKHLGLAALIAIGLNVSASAQTFPNGATTGVPDGWLPQSIVRSTITVNTAGAVIEDIRIVDADIVVNADNVTIRRVEMRGGRIENRPGDVCRSGLLIEDVTITRSQRVTRDTDQPAVGTGGYRANRVEIVNRPQGFRVGGGSSGGCGATTIENSFAHIERPDVCDDWHGDGIQGYDGPPVVVRNTTLRLGSGSGCLRGGGTAPFFYPHSQGNTSAVVDRLLVMGGGYPFRLGMPGTVAGLRIVDGWGFGPIDVKCSLVSEWDVKIVTVNKRYRVTAVLDDQTCNTEGGG